eukprot:CAMPEP_0183797032 /NCGR_PEP_ID=MMETSP0803_2-20130417/14145_1 /TAXON_ID=195967 /ORGANISM="Crustomastix stigmata, Strain CCMP3273" /LENGTH=44 /DNA_ID= /DNA_START= /DNA_END= /DNA_ORIENTATION=
MPGAASARPSAAAAAAAAAACSGPREASPPARLRTRGPPRAPPP